MSAVVDILGREYGYEPEVIMDMPVLGVLRLMHRIAARYSKSKKKLPSVGEDFIKEYFDHA